MGGGGRVGGGGGAGAGGGGGGAGGHWDESTGKQRLAEVVARMGLEEDREALEQALGAALPGAYGREPDKPHRRL